MMDELKKCDDCDYEIVREKFKQCRFCNSAVKLNYLE